MKKLVHVLSWLTAALGLAHLVFTFTPVIMAGTESLSQQVRDGVTFFSIGCGTALILAGLLLGVEVRSGNPHRSAVWIIAVTGAILGVAAPYYLGAAPSALLVTLFGFATLIAAPLWLRTAGPLPKSA
jgi:hypothetical protein